jgi:hypothetical protein
MKETKMKESSTLTLRKRKGKKYWCIISASCLYIFDNPQDKKPLYIIPLDNLEIESLVDGLSEDGLGFFLFKKFKGKKKKKKKMTISIIKKKNFLVANGLIKSAVDGKELLLKEIQFFCEDRKSKMEWMLHFKLNLVHAPTYK